MTIESDYICPYCKHSGSHPNTPEDECPFLISGEGCWTAEHFSGRKMIDQEAMLKEMDAALLRAKETTDELDRARHNPFGIQGTPVFKSSQEYEKALAVFQQAIKEDLSYRHHGT